MRMSKPPAPPEKCSRGSNKLIRFSTLALLYFVQGAPYGFQTGCLPLLLRGAGLSFSNLGAMKLLFLPWVCKPLYAPFIERTKSRLWWLVASMLVLGFTCLLAASTAETMLGPLASILFLLNLASATQDICVDSLAIKILNESELGAGNTIQVVAYKSGSVFAGASLLWVKDISSWSVMWLVFASVYFICISLVWGLGLIKTEKRRGEDVNISSQPSFYLLKENIFSILEVPGTSWMVCFVLFYKLCERGEGTLPVYLLDKGVPMSQLAFWTGIVRSVASLGGSSLCGFLLTAKFVFPINILKIAAQLRCFPLVLQFLLIRVWGTEPIQSPDSLSELGVDSVLFYLAITSLCFANFCAGLLTTACFTSMMTLSQSAPEHIQSSHYSFLATMEVLGKLAFATISGGLIDNFGIDFVFVIFAMLAVLTVPLLWSMPTSGKER